MIPEEYLPRIELIKKILHSKRVLVALSGGVDSTLVLLLALKYAYKTIPVFFNAPIFSKNEINGARILCAALGIQLEVIEFNPLNNDDFISNPPNRCYICKTMIMKDMINIKNEMGFDAVLEGTNLTEIQVEKDRPGFKALKELKIISPLVIGNFQKQDIRSLIGFINQNPAKFLNLDLDDSELKLILEKIKYKPSNPCLCSRIEYNSAIGKEILDRIDDAELFLKNYLDIEYCRVRFHSNNLVRIELPLRQIHRVLNQKSFKLISGKLKELGFKFITLDMEGFRSGNLNPV